MHNLLKLFIFTALLAPLISYAMEYEPDRIKLGKKLVRAAENNNWKKVKILIKQKADLNQKDKYNAGWTALMYAIYSNHQAMVCMLIDAQADLYQKSHRGNTALMLAAIYERSGICRMIVQAQINRIAKRKECVYTTSLCLKRIFGVQYPHIRNIFKPMLQTMIQEVRQPVLDDINRIENDAIKQELLALCNRHQLQKGNS